MLGGLLQLCQSNWSFCFSCVFGRRFGLAGFRVARAGTEIPSSFSKRAALLVLVTAHLRFTLEDTGIGRGEMDIIAQLQDQANKIAYIAFNTVGSLQRDAPAARLGQNYPDPPAPTAEALAVKNEEPKLAAASFVQAVKQFDALVAALPIHEGGEEAQLKRISELQAENESIGKDLQHEVDAAEKELRQLRDLFHMAADNCLRLKPPS